ncbi:MAG TPA: YHS domain-containing protein [Verrucomicrobiae bacterium]|nr:YHS domain-containing protein [Verrucomicrobiae bacterium]
MRKISLWLLAITLITGSAQLALGAGVANKAKLKPYPLDKCVVSGEKLNEMGKPYEYEYKGREIKFCCKDCVKDFNKNPQKYIKKLEQAEAKKKHQS